MSALQPAPSPPATAVPPATPAQPWAVDPELAQRGFRVIPQLADGEGVQVLRQAYDDIRAKRIDCGDDDRHLGGLTHQVMHPSQYDERFRDHPAVAAAKVLAAQWMGWQQATLHFDMLICKPPGHPAPTPWHQDAAYGAHPFAEAGCPVAQRTLQFWLALDDVGATSGCMHFSPEVSLDRLLPHQVVGDDYSEGRLLAIPDADLQAFGQPLPITACPLAAGGCTVHGEGTLHMTTPNQHLSRWRRAYIFNLSDAGAGYFD